MRPAAFTLTADHIALLRHAYVGWDECEAGAPAIDPKRPYGNGDVIKDVGKIIGAAMVSCPHCGEIVAKSEEARCLAIHRETATALQIILATGQFRPGLYRNPGYGLQWVLVSETK